MSFVDVTVPYAQAGVSAQVGGAPSGGGVQYSSGKAPTGQPGGGAMGTNVAVNHWALIFLLIDTAILVAAGVIFNGKG